MWKCGCVEFVDVLCGCVEFVDVLCGSVDVWNRWMCGIGGCV